MNRGVVILYQMELKITENLKTCEIQEISNKC